MVVVRPKKGKARERRRAGKDQTTTKDLRLNRGELP